MTMCVKKPNSVFFFGNTHSLLWQCVSICMYVYVYHQVTVLKTFIGGEYIVNHISGSLDCLRSRLGYLYRTDITENLSSYCLLCVLLKVSYACMYIHTHTCT